MGIRTITVDIYLVFSGRIAFIGTDAYKAGLNMGNLMIKLLGGQGSIVLSVLNLDQENQGSRV